jgi:GT2 family glycosyltransferase
MAESKAAFEDTMTVCVTIPTYQREGVLVETIRQVVAQDPPADEVLVIDQSADHERSTLVALKAWQEEGKIRWIKHSPPNLPGARNRALIEAQSDIVIFIDDDVVLTPGFVDVHRRCYGDSQVYLVAGQVLNKDRQVHSGAVQNYELRFPRNHDERTWIKAIWGGNHSVRRRFALELGGFDERYFGGASREESDLAARAFERTGRMVLFEPSASLVHLAESTGGCRAWGGYFHPLAAGWAVGDYYFALRNLRFQSMARHIVRRFLRSVLNRYCLHHPWAVLPIVVREAVSLVWGIVVSARSRKLISLTMHSRSIEEVAKRQ